MSEISSIIGKNQRKVYLDKFPRTEVEEIRNIVDHICKFKGYSEQPEINNINSRLFNFDQNKFDILNIYIKNLFRIKIEMVLKNKF